MKKIAIYGLVGATILSSSSSIFGAETFQTHEIMNDYTDMNEEEVQEILEARVQRVCEVLGKELEEISKQELLEVVARP